MSLSSEGQEEYSIPNETPDLGPAELGASMGRQLGKTLEEGIFFELYQNKIKTSENLSGRYELEDGTRYSILVNTLSWAIVGGYEDKRYRLLMEYSFPIRFSFPIGLITRKSDWREGELSLQICGVDGARLQSLGFEFRPYSKGKESYSVPYRFYFSPETMRGKGFLLTNTYEMDRRLVPRFAEFVNSVQEKAKMAKNEEFKQLPSKVQRTLLSEFKNCVEDMGKALRLYESLESLIDGDSLLGV